MARALCEAMRKDGTSCRAVTLPTSTWCWTHHPERQDIAAAARRSGRVKANRLIALRGKRSKLSTVPELVRFVATLVHRVIDGELTPDVARVALYGLHLQKSLVELSDLERRLTALEAAAVETGSQKSGRAWLA